MRKPRVLMVAPSLGVYGGIEAFTATIAKQALDAGDVEVKVVYRLRGNSELKKDLSEGIESHGVRWRAMRLPDFTYLRELLWADLIHCHFPLLYAVLPARIFGKKLIISMENRRMPEHHFFHVWLLKLGHLRWYIAKFVAQTWEGPQLKKGSYVIPATTKLPMTFNPPHQRKGFFFIARWVPLKGIEPLIEAYATAQIDRKKHPLILAGDGPLKDQILQKIKDLGLKNDVRTPGFISFEEKSRMIASSRWNLAPVAFEEDLGLTPIEARSCGVPSIISDIGGVPEAAGCEGLLCIPGDVPSLRQKLEEAANMSEEDYQKRSEDCLESIRTYLPPNDFYPKAYKALLQNS